MSDEPVIAPGGFEIDQRRIMEQIQWAQSTGHANCYVQLMGFQGDDRWVMTVVDLFREDMPTKSVTNDAEYVTMTAWNAAQHSEEQPDIPIVYCDTDGNWDELRHREGHFACFRSLNTKDRDEACRIVLALHEQDATKQRRDH